MLDESMKDALRVAREDVSRLYQLAIHLDRLARDAYKRIDEAEDTEDTEVAVRGLISVGYCIGAAVGECDEYSKEAKERLK